MQVYLLHILFAISVIGVLCDDNDFKLDAYYWKDYIGKPPFDALPGGTQNGRTTYIGQVLHRSLLIPAEIEPRAGTVYYEWGYQAHQPSNYTKVKILCTPYPTRFKWVSTGNKRLEKLEAKLPFGGFEENADIYVGRKLFGNDVVVGKVISTSLQSTLNVVRNGNVTQHGEFDVLTYDPAVNVPEQDKPRGKCPKKKLFIKLFN